MRIVPCLVVVVGGGCVFCVLLFPVSFIVFVLTWLASSPVESSLC